MGQHPLRRPGSPERFEPAFRSFLTRHVSQTKGTYETTRIYERDLLPAFRGKVLSDITKRDVINLLDGVVDRGSPVMANRVLAALRKFFSWAVSRDLARQTLVKGSSRLPKSSHVIVFSAMRRLLSSGGPVRLWAIHTGLTSSFCFSLLNGALRSLT